jgi:hypothetical protein
MKTAILNLVITLILALFLTACGKPHTPQEVAREFWNSVIEGNVSGVIKYSTLASEEGYDAFSYDWLGMIPSWGKVIIEEQEARVHTHISRPDAATSEMLNFVTYLVKQDDAWRVDYEKTEKVVRASSVVSEFVNQINSIGNEITQQFEEASRRVTAELESLNDQLVELTESIGNQASQTITEYSEIIRLHLDALAASIENALKEQKENIDPDDRETMENTVKELNQSSRKLAQPDMSSIAESGEVIVITRENLNKINSDNFQDYQAQWQELTERIKQDLEDLLNELSAEVQ